MIELRATAPVFPVDDVGATVRWFEQKLGFSYSTHPQVEPFEWASMVRDNVEIMLQRVVGYEKPSLNVISPFMPMVEGGTCTPRPLKPG